MADEQAAPSSIIPPAEEKHDAPKETVLGDKPKEPEEGVPVSTSGPVSESKTQSALNEIPAPKTDLSEDDAHKVQAEKELKEKSPVGGSEVEAIEGKGEKPPEMKTVDQAVGEKEEEKKKKKEEESGEGSAEGEKEKEKEGKETSEANGPASDKKAEEEDESKETGEKRGAAAVTNGGAAEEPAEKKAKTTEGAPTTNGGSARRGSKAKNKKEPAPVGKTARRTRSQGLTES